MRRALLALVLLFALPQASHAEGDVAALLARFQKVHAMTARFREEKRMALLAVPLVSEGRVYYQKPRLLARHTDTPARASVVLHDGELSFGDARHKESLSVQAQPALQVLVDTYVAVLSGDARALERMASVKADIDGEKFRIVVTPKSPDVLKLVKEMSFEGQGATLLRMELLDANGDRTLTTFEDVRLREPFSADEQERLFRVGG